MKDQPCFYWTGIHKLTGYFLPGAFHRSEPFIVVTRPLRKISALILVTLQLLLIQTEAATSQ